uniref:Ig-like domain-containing protein n=1 Tax=Mola mola TaxID=94237 RepID=A0A3Q3WIV7_MOLML
ANCSLQRMCFSVLGWEVLLGSPAASTNRFLVWSVDRMTKWSIKPVCFALLEQGDPCQINLPVTVYKPPDNVSIDFVNHTGPMLEGHPYTLQCIVHDVAPVKNLMVTFYRGQTRLDTLQSNKNTERSEPVTEIFTLNITPSKDDDGVQYWCQAKLELGPDGPLPPPVVMSQNFTATVFCEFNCKHSLLEGDSLSCKVRGNPQPLVTWYRDGQVVVLPTHSSKKHAGKYTVLAKGPFEQKNFTLEVEILGGSGKFWKSALFCTVLYKHVFLEFIATSKQID